MLKEGIHISTPKTPKKSDATKRLEREQLLELNRQKADAAAAIALRKKRIKQKSLGRRSLLRTGERGIEDLQSQAETLPEKDITKPIITTGG